MIHDSKCLQCVNFLKTTEDYTPICNAFTEGIPYDIFWGVVDHTKSYPGDNGIQFEAKEK